MNTGKPDRSTSRKDDDEKTKSLTALIQMAAIAGVQLPTFCHGPGGVPTQSDVDALIAAKTKRERRAERNRCNWGVRTETSPNAPGCAVVDDRQVGKGEVAGGDAGQTEARRA